MAVQEQMMFEAMDAVALISSGIDRLLEMADATDFGALGPENLMATMRAFEAQRNRLSAVDHGFVEAAEMESLWERTTARGTAGAMAQILHLSKAEANARVRAAKWFGPRITLDGQELPPALPLVSAAQRDGTASGAQAEVIGRCIDELACKPELSTDEVRDAEQYLVDYASAFGPRELQRLAAKIVDVLIPDGTPPRDDLVNARRGISIGAQRRDGTATISGVLTPEVRAQLWAVLSPLSAPRKNEHGESDTRTAAQRRHDALGEACARLLSSGDLPSSGGVPATVIVTTTVEQVQAAAECLDSDGVSWDQRSPSFTTVDGTRLSLTQFLRIAGEAEIVPTFLDAAGGILAYGRNRRVASPGQMRALIARDSGCSFPDCDVPPQWCEAHHVVPWIAGGATDVSNLALGCKYHHRHFEERDWECKMVDGLPWWIPPPWVDPERKPLKNWHAHTRYLPGLDQIAQPDLASRDPEPCDPKRRDPEPSCLNTESSEPSIGPEPQRDSGAVPCAMRAHESVSITELLPHSANDAAEAFDLSYRNELANAVNDAMASWVERALIAAEANDDWAWRADPNRAVFSLDLAYPG